jgi:hypothetical protein
MASVAKPRSAVLALLLLAVARVAEAAECACPVIMERDGWCEVHALGYVAGLEIETYLLFEALDAHGHQVDHAAFPCPSCQRAIGSDGFCDEHRLGFVGGLAYYSRLTFLVAKARASGAVGCAECREVAARGGWCEACGGAGFIGPVVFRDRRAYDETGRALDLVHRADVVGRRCEQCAVAMVTDSLCPLCKLEYRGGEARPFRPAAPDGGPASADPP